MEEKSTPGARDAWSATERAKYLRRCLIERNPQQAM
jgi:hypothetical protein